MGPKAGSRAIRMTWRIWLAALAAAAALGAVAGAGARSARALAAAAPGEALPVVEYVDGHPVVFQFGRPVPSFSHLDEGSPFRTTARLAGWSFTTDPDDRGFEQGWHLPGFDDSGWRQVRVPHVWDEEGGGTLATYDGRVWYRAKFALPPSLEGLRVRLIFLGAADRASVYVNGAPVGTHRAAYLPFALDVTDEVRAGEESVVAVSLRRRAWGSVERDVLPPGDHDWWLYGGLYRDVWLEIVPELSVARILAGYRDGVMHARVVVQNEGEAEQRVAVRLDPGLPGGVGRKERWVTVPGRSTAIATFEFAAEPGHLWSPADPRLFTATATLLDGDGRPVDQLSEVFGLADVAVRGARIEVAGEPVFIKGVNWHSDVLGSGAALSRADVARDFALMKEAGANLVRFSHYPREPWSYRLASELGLFVIDEAPNYWMDRAAISHQLEDGLSLGYIRSMVWNHMNYPAVLLWSLLNESETGVRGGETARRFIEELAQAVRELDLSRRPVTYASNHHRDDVGFGLVDVIGINEYFGFFYGRHDDLGPLLDFLHGRYPGKPILITEFGDWAVRGTAREAIQAYTFQRHWEQLLAREEFVAGGVWWLFADHKSRHQPDSAIPYISTMGMVDRDRNPKRLYEVFRSAPLPQGAAGRAAGAGAAGLAGLTGEREPTRARQLAGARGPEDSPGEGVGAE